jgi:hypothetical protein
MRHDGPVGKVISADRAHSRQINPQIRHIWDKSTCFRIFPDVSRQAILYIPIDVQTNADFVDSLAGITDHRYDSFELLTRLCSAPSRDWKGYVTFNWSQNAFTNSKDRRTRTLNLTFDPTAPPLTFLRTTQDADLHYVYGRWFDSSNRLQIWNVDVNLILKLIRVK